MKLILTTNFFSHNIVVAGSGDTKYFIRDMKRNKQHMVNAPNVLKMMEANTIDVHIKGKLKISC